MMLEYESSSSTLEKLVLLIFIVAIVIGNICVFVTYFLHADGKHWSQIFVLGMALIDLFIGSFVLPMRFQSTYGNPLTAKLCAALSIGESCALAAVIYAVSFMIYVRLYILKSSSRNINRLYLFMILLSSWIAFFLFYGVAFMTNYQSYLLLVVSITTNTTSYCTTYLSSIHRPTWMAYTEIGIIYLIPILCICFGIVRLIANLQQPKPMRLDQNQRIKYGEQRQMTWHVLILSATFMFLWLPWIVIRILILFYKSRTTQTSLQITYYILILKCVLFPILYASTNASFRGSFAIYRHKRITTNIRIWPTNERF